MADCGSDNEAIFNANRAHLNEPEAKISRINQAQYIDYQPQGFVDRKV